MPRKPADPIEAFEKATRDLVAAKSDLDRATAARAQAAKDAYNAGLVTYRELAERSTAHGLPMGLKRAAQIVNDGYGQ